MKNIFHLLLQKIKTAFILFSNGQLWEIWRNSETEFQRNRRVAIWENVPLSGKPVRDKLANGERIELYPGDLLSKLIYFRNFEQDEQKFLRKFLRPTDIFIDVGANLGLYTIIAARIVGKKGKIYSFEPSKVNFERLTRNVQLNHYQNVICVQLALSDAEESREFLVSTDGFGAYNSLGKPSAGERFNTEVVSCLTWDQFAIKNQLIDKIALMKIDVEGWESRVFNGGKQFFSREDAPDLLVEFTEINAKINGSSCEILFQQLMDFGYQIYLINMEKQTLERQEEWHNYDYINLFATKRLNLVLDRLGFSCV
ncbi:MAG: FkbM family methyltransferase [Candidatus Kuenenia stuttgartiensis]|nr:FkbM family methyltransferase [Candidatus Kuenenia stuttgartiensis]